MKGKRKTLLRILYLCLPIEGQNFPALQHERRWIRLANTGEGNNKKTTQSEGSLECGGKTPEVRQRKEKEKERKVASFTDWGKIYSLPYVYTADVEKKRIQRPTTLQQSLFF